MWALLFHLRTHLHLLTAISKVEVLLTCVCPVFHCATCSLMHFLLKNSISLLARLPLVIGHCYELNITKPRKLFEVRHKHTPVNWEYLSSVLEVDDKETFGVSVKQFPPKLLQSINGRIEVYQFISTNNMLTHSKPYWHAKMIGLKLDNKNASESSTLNIFRQIKQSCSIFS